MFRRSDDNGYRTVLEGVQLKALVHGERTLLTEFRIAKGASIPTHRHPNEQTGYLVSGRLRFVVDGEVINAGPGDSWNLAANVDHSADALEDTVVVEVFSPVREDYLD
jgi:quercetin dioxygenase-like cupin family protein